MDKYFKTEFGEMYYYHLDNQKHDTVMLLHGNASSAMSFNPMIQQLKNNYNIVALDFAGHGLSSHIREKNHMWYYSMLGFRDSFLNFYKFLNLKNVIIAGNSLGANIAVQALPYLNDLKGLVLMASVHADGYENFFENILPAAPKDLALKNQLTDNEIKIVASAFIHPSKQSLFCFQQMQKDIKNADGQFRSSLVDYMKTQYWPDEVELLKKTRVPLLYFSGQEDGFIRPSYYEKLKLRVGLRDQQLRLIEDVSHMPHLESPETSATLISNFIEKITEMEVV